MDNITKMLEAYRSKFPHIASLWGRREITMNTPNLRDDLMGRVMNIPTLRKTDTQPRQPIQIKDPPGYDRPNVVAARIETHKELLSQAPAGSEEYFRVVRNLAKLERKLHDMYKRMEKGNA
jgi:hypothetical protein